jgi:hypothetical protein
MRIQSTLLMMAVLTSLASREALAASNLVVANPTGDMRVQIPNPIGENVDKRTAVTLGRIEIAEGRAFGGSDITGKHFVLTRVSLHFADFGFDRAVFGEHQFREIAVHLVDAVPFDALQIQPGVYHIFIPANEVALQGGAVVDGDLEAGTDHPRDAVTGTIDLNSGTIEMTVVLRKRKSILIYDLESTLTITLTGTLGPDTDGDGVRDGRDNCRLVSNPGQEPVMCPVVTAPPDVQFASCVSVALGVASAVDVCDGGPVAVSHNAPPKFNAGTTLVTWTGQTASGRVGGATQRVTVVDMMPPTFTYVPPTITVKACKRFDLGRARAVDDCDAGPPRVTHTRLRLIRRGLGYVNWIATDVAGNRATARQLVKIVPCGRSCRHSHHHDRDNDHGHGDHGDRDDHHHR